ncbi:MAG: hypothetical protein H0X38_12090 [Planctomycetes bacterium]|nr:hypothetical protein [Planctomycetota bacterium]
MSGQRYLIIANKTGQLGNRLVVYAHMLGAARERGWTVLNPSFGEYADHFTGTRGRLATQDAEPLVNPPRLGEVEREHFYRLNRAGYKLARTLHHLPIGGIGWARAREVLHYDLEELLDRADARGWRWLFTQNYHFRQHAWCARHAGHIRRVFTPVEPHRSAGEAAVARARTRGDVVIGVHIRHGDYRQHLGGRFFYELPVYAGLMRQLAAALAPRRAVFLVCSNATNGPEDFAGLAIAPGPGHMVADLHALSRCDHIFGPPSSFSAWAAFHGQVPYRMIEDPAQPISPRDFLIPASPDPKY